MVVAAIVATLLCFLACSGSGADDKRSDAQTITITDMLGRNVTMAKDIHRILALHPIPTALLELLAPQQIVSIDTVSAQTLTEDDVRFTAEQMSSLKSLPVTGVYFKGFDPEQVMKLHPNVVITMTGDTNIDRAQRQTGVPFFAVSKAPTASYETTIRLIGQIVGRQDRADQMATFWAENMASVQAKTATVPARHRPTVMYTGKNGDILDIPGKDTVFGATIEVAGGRYVGDTLAASHAGTENNPVSIEQVITWDPDVIIVASTGIKNSIIDDPRWHTLEAVQNGQVYVPPQYGGLDGLQAVLGMVWTQGVLLNHDDANARATTATTMQNYYQLFYGHPLTPTQIDQPASR
jgi:iron complex transport system substrate-binding protein